MSMINKLIKGGTSGDIYFIRAVDSLGLDCWFYMQIPAIKQPLFEKTQAGMKVELTDFGTVIESGYERPSDYIRGKMEKEYGFKTE